MSKEETRPTKHEALKVTYESIYNVPINIHDILKGHFDGGIYAIGQYGTDADKDL